MKVITRQSKVAYALESFFKNYESFKSKNGPFHTKERYDAVVALGDNPTADDVEKVLNHSWVGCDCSECGKSVELYVEVGQELGYDSLTAYLCKDCLYDAYVLLCKAECEK